jgi:hypothetical protein
MYGLIHRAMQQMVIDSHGALAWKAIETEQGIGPAELISLSTFEDALTIRLLTAVSDMRDEPIEDTLRVFGRYWVSFVSKDSYGTILDFTGRDLATLLRNLNRMHQTVQVTMPDAVVPNFTLLEESADGLLVEYRSARSGMQPMVLGLLEGLVAKFALTAQVEQISAHGGTGQFRINFVRETLAA